LERRGGIDEDWPSKRLHWKNGLSVGRNETKPGPTRSSKREGITDEAGTGGGKHTGKREDRAGLKSHGGNAVQGRQNEKPSTWSKKKTRKTLRIMNSNRSEAAGKRRRLEIRATSLSQKKGQREEVKPERRKSCNKRRGLRRRLTDEGGEGDALRGLTSSEKQR